MTQHNRIFNDEQHQFFVEYNSKYNAKDLAELINQTFNLTITATQIKNYRKNNKLPCGRDTKFKKGQIAYNKGKRFPNGGNSGSFKKGHGGTRNKPVGFIRKN